VNAKTTLKPGDDESGYLAYNERTGDAGHPRRAIEIELHRKENYLRWTDNGGLPATAADEETTRCCLVDRSDN